jgi:hypothetical protein
MSHGQKQVDPDILQSLAMRVEVVKQDFEKASPGERDRMLVRWDAAVTDLTNAVLYGKLPRRE